MWSIESNSLINSQQRLASYALSKSETSSALPLDTLVNARHENMLKSTTTASSFAAASPYCSADLQLLVNQIMRKQRRSEYRDYADVALLRSCEPRQQQQHSLPDKLYAILSNPNYEHVVSWLPHGRAWKIHNLNKFATLILPLYFEHLGGCNESSSGLNTFLRLLKIWGFRQLTEGADISAYYHEMFLRSTDLHKLMRPSENNLRKALESFGHNPDLYAYPPLPAHPSLAAATHKSLPDIPLGGAGVGGSARGMGLHMFQDSLHHDLASPPTVSRLQEALDLSTLAMFDQEQQQIKAAVNSATSFLPPQQHAATYWDHHPLTASNMVEELVMRSHANISTSRQMLMSEEMRLAQELHDRSMTRMQQARKCNEVEDAGNEKKKRPRKKWLPPLGPPVDPKLLLHLKKGSNNGTDSSSPQKPSTA